MKVHFLQKTLSWNAFSAIIDLSFQLSSTLLRELFICSLCDRAFISRTFSKFKIVRWDIVERDSFESRISTVQLQLRKRLTPKELLNCWLAVGLNFKQCFSLSNAASRFISRFGWLLCNFRRLSQYELRTTKSRRRNLRISHQIMIYNVDDSLDQSANITFHLANLH